MHSGSTGPTRLKVRLSEQVTAFVVIALLTFRSLAKTYSLRSVSCEDQHFAKLVKKVAGAKSMVEHSEALRLKITRRTVENPLPWRVALGTRFQ